MVSLADIYNEYRDNDIRLYEYESDVDAATIEIRGRYAVFTDFFKCTSLAEMKWKLCHEYGHCVTGATHKLGSPYQLKAQHEFKANKKAALTFLPPQDFKAAFDNGVHEAWELAEWFDVPEEHVINIFDYYSMNSML